MFCGGGELFSKKINRRLSKAFPWGEAVTQSVTDEGKHSTSNERKMKLAMLPPHPPPTGAPSPQGEGFVPISLANPDD